MRPKPPPTIQPNGTVVAARNISVNYNKQNIAQHLSIYQLGHILI